MLIRKTIKELGYDVYDGFLPPDKTPYPFVFIGETYQIDKRNKSRIFGEITQTVDIWIDTPRKRGTLSEMALEIKRACFSLNKTENFSLDVELNTQFTRPDISTNSTLMRSHLEFKIKFN